MATKQEVITEEADGAAHSQDSGENFLSWSVVKAVYNWAQRN